MPRLFLHNRDGAGPPIANRNIMRNRTDAIWPYLFGAALGLVVFIGVALLAKKQQSTKQDQTFVRYNSGETKCFDGMRHTVDDGFVQVFDGSQEISIPEVKVTSVRTSQNACNQ